MDVEDLQKFKFNFEKLFTEILDLNRKILEINKKISSIDEKFEVLFNKSDCF
jgi:hypothetical protein